MKKMLLLLFVCIAVALRTEAQETISGVVRNSYDSSRIPFARVSVAGGKRQVATGANGQFSLPANITSDTLQIRVSALGIDSVFSFSAPFPKSFLLWVVPKGFEIGTTVIRGFSAKEVVKEAIKRIPQNYLTEGYLYYGFYRQYHLNNTKFQNLVEARLATMVRPVVNGKRLEAECRFLPLAMRRQNYRSCPVEGIDETDGIIEGVFDVNPVYNFDKSSFLPTVFNGARFRFDTTVSDLSTYIIDYVANSSAEDHGLQYERGRFTGESYETGRLIIDRKTFAFVHIERKTFRNRWYNYNAPFNNNVIYPSERYLVELRDGQLDIWYKQNGDHWILARLRHGFTNEFYPSDRLSPISNGPDYVLGQYYEWKTDSVSRYVPGEMLPQFYKNPMLHFVGMPADSISAKTPPFFFFPKEKVYSAVGWETD